MEYILYILPILFIIYLLLPDRSRSKSGRVSKEQRVLDENIDWLMERWSEAKENKSSGKPTLLPDWYFDESRQLWVGPHDVIPQ